MSQSRITNGYVCWPRWPLLRLNLQVYVFTEIIRQARDRGQPLKFASQILYDAIRAANIDPTWEELSLPGGKFRKSPGSRSQLSATGRTLRSYQDVFWNFQGPAIRYQPQQPKRPLPFDPATQTGRPLAPKPVQPGPTGHHALGGPSPTTTLSPLAGTQTFSPEQRRRRGRPSKKEQEERRRRLSENRAQIPPPLQPTSVGFGMQQLQQPRMAGPGEVPQSPAPSAPSLAGTVAATAQGPEAHRQNSNSGGSNGGRNKKRSRPPNPPTEAQPEAPPPPTFGGAPEQQRHAPAGGEIQGGGGQTTNRDERRASEGSSRGPYGASSAASEAQGAEQEDGSKSADLRRILND